MSTVQSTRRSGLDLAARSIEFVAPYKLAAVGILTLALLSAILGAADPLVMKYLFDALGSGRAGTALLLAVAALLALELGRAGLGASLNVRTWDVRLAVDFALRERLLAKLHALPMAYHQRQGVGGLMTKVNQSVTAFVAAYGEIAFNALPTLVYLVLSVLAMWRLEWRLAVLVLPFTPLPAALGAWAAREQRVRERRLLRRWTRIYSRLNEVLAGIRTVKAFAMEHAELRRFLGAQRDGNEIVRRGVRTDAITGAARGLAATLARLAAIGVGGLLVARGEITLGTLVAFLGYITGLFGPVQGLTNIYQSVQKASVALEAIFEVLDADEVVGDAPGARDLARAQGEVRFENVSFAYDHVPVLSNVSLHAAPGEMIALVGRSGSGKTTLVTLLERLYPVSSGSITLDGADIRSISLQSLRRQIAVVAQDVHLFNDTVRANIAYGRPGATPAEVEAAACDAHAHEFIAALPDGYDTVVGERGSRLSGGQRQRLALARALLKDAPILILDEATSALDPVSESIVQDALDRLRRGRTTIVIAHRMSTIISADRIIVIKDGETVAAGRHEQLLAESPYYASLVGEVDEGYIVTRAA
jgi:ATP-binding cassette, subfamily B, bacterial